MWAKHRISLRPVGGGYGGEGVGGSHIEPTLTDVLCELERSCVELVHQDKTHVGSRCCRVLRRDAPLLFAQTPQKMEMMNV